MRQRCSQESSPSTPPPPGNRTMKIIRYEHGGQSGIGVMVDDSRFVGLLEAVPQLPPTLLGIMALGDGLEPVRRAVEGRAPNLSIADVTLRPFLDHPNAVMAPDEFGEPATHSVTTRVNGVVRQRAPLDDMLFDVPPVISYLSQGYELRPGDMIAMGTPGVLPAESQDVEGLDLARQHGPFKIPGLVHMRPGDVVEVEISGLGVLRNAVVADAPAHYRTSGVAAEGLPC